VNILRAIIGDHMVGEIFSWRRRGLLRQMCRSNGEGEEVLGVGLQTLTDTILIGDSAAYGNVESIWRILKEKYSLNEGAVRNQPVDDWLPPLWWSHTHSDSESSLDDYVDQ
jgi:hypothetical protein